LRHCPDLWLGGIATAIGLRVWAYDKHWQAGVLAGLVAMPLLGVLYALLAWFLGGPRASEIGVVVNALDLLDAIFGLLSLFS
jgi:hypothetical protein